MSLYDKFYNIPEKEVPEPFDNCDVEHADQCDCCYEYSDVVINHKGYTICESCVNNQEGLNPDEIVEIIEKNSKSMISTMANINSLCDKVLHPYD